MDTRVSRALVLALPVLAACASLVGCERVKRAMDDQPKLKTDAQTPLFANGAATRPPPPRSAMRSQGEAAADTSGRVGVERVTVLDAADRRQALDHAEGPALDADHRRAAMGEATPTALEARGRERYTIYCVPCHGVVGDGLGIVVQRGFPAPPSYRVARLREATDRHLFDVVTHGYGVMHAYGDRVDAADRWAIVAYVRRLQSDIRTPALAASAVATNR